MNIYDYSCYTLSNFSESSQGITPLKLQKLLYYLKVWSLVANKNIIPEPFLHWEYGPVNIFIYDKYKSYIGNPIDAPCNQVQIPQDKEFVDFILENYIDFHALDLSSLTHSEDPWKNTPENSIISDKSILDYYSKQSFAMNFPLSQDKPYFPVMSDSNHSFIFDMSEDDAKKSLVYASYNEYKKLKEAAKKELASGIQKIVK